MNELSHTYTIVCVVQYCVMSFRSLIKVAGGRFMIHVPTPWQSLFFFTSQKLQEPSRWDIFWCHSYAKSVSGFPNKAQYHVRWITLQKYKLGRVCVTFFLHRLNLLRYDPHTAHALGLGESGQCLLKVKCFVVDVFFDNLAFSQICDMGWETYLKILLFIPLFTDQLCNHGVCSVRDPTEGGISLWAIRLCQQGGHETSTMYMLHQTEEGKIRAKVI